MATMTESVSGHLGKDIEMTGDVERAATGDAGRLDGRVHRTSLANKNDSSARSDPSENGKKKPKEEKPPSKVVIRRLPPSMTKDVFVSQISPIPEHDYLYFVPGDPTMGNLMGFSRAYINFINQEDLFRFTETYDNYVFVDVKGQEYPAIVEFAPFQRIPKQRAKKRDQLCGCIETDPIYVAFKESLEAAAADAAKPDVTSKQHFFETEVTPSAPQEMTTTPLLEFLKQKRADRARMRDERKEERKRKEAERKLRQKAIKEKKEAEEEHKDIKLLQPKDKKETNNKESRNGRRPEKEKPAKEIRPREFRNRSNKNFSEEKSRGEKKDERKRDGGGGEKKDDKKETTCKESKDEVKEKVVDDSTNGNVVSDKGKGGGGERRRGGDRKKFEGEKEGGEESSKKSRNERNRSVRKERERKRRDDYLAKKNLEKKNNEGNDKKKSKNFKNGNNGDSGVISDSKDTCKDTKQDVGEVEDGISRLAEKEEREKKQETNDDQIVVEESAPKTPQRRSSLEFIPETNKTSNEKGQMKRRNSLESGSSISSFRGRKGSSRDRRSGGKREAHEGVSEDKRGTESDSSEGKSRRSREEKTSKSDQEDCKKDEKDARPARRIRNKDRPSIQIYRPGMGKLSKQRLEKEKTLGSSTEVDSPSHSPSPVPKTKPPS
ncbi:hypothetical protein GE061_017018 [Apolygus lucorum]|uniref:UPF3 domain-containing protein n=1 Tax=Apolygus lucorum TaxID=248454 RepID=A0A6A4JZ19_APOLU|nr:hypothetical protein GE061_017018 [Apolygus lucorum]